MLIGSVNKSFINFREDDNNLSLLLVRYGVIENEFLVELRDG